MAQQRAVEPLIDIYIFKGTRYRSWLGHCATSQKVAGSFSDKVI
jgi:hypothetical protein